MPLGLRRPASDRDMAMVRAHSISLAMLLLPACSSAGADGVDTGDTGGATGDVAPEPLDPDQLDRSEANLDADGCGYPGPGPDGYGTELGERIENFVLVDCDGNQVEFADFFCERDDIGVHNRAVLLNIGAGWCEPCRVETLEDLVPEYAATHDQGLEIVQVLFQDWDGMLPTKSFCTDWKAGEWKQGNVGVTLTFPVLVDQVNDWRQIYLSSPMAQTPMNFLLDANANIRWKIAGERPEGLPGVVGAVMETPYGP